MSSPQRKDNFKRGEAYNSNANDPEGGEYMVAPIFDLTTLPRRPPEWKNAKTPPPSFGLFAYLTPRC